jgi:N-methylhydantoinase A
VTALVTTRGFSDVLQIARQNRPLLYDLNHRLPEPLVPADLRYGINERVTDNGDIIQELELEEIDRLLPELTSRKVESIAVCCLFSFLNPDHEAMVASRLRQAGYLVSVSSEILPEYREYERRVPQ